MSDQDLQRRLIEQQQLKKLLQYEKQQLLQQSSYESPKQCGASPQPQLQTQSYPYIYAQSFILPKRQNKKPYFVDQIDSRIADRQSGMIVSAWMSQNQTFPDQISLRRIQRQSRRSTLQKELTAQGKQYIQEILAIARSTKKTGEKVSLRQKYQRSYKKQQLVGSQQA